MKGLNEKMKLTKKSDKGKLLILALLPLILLIVSLCIGRYYVNPQTTFSLLLSNFFPVESIWEPIEELIILKVRLPRVLMALIIGAGLSVSGTAFQSIFGNPLVSPHVLGVSAGAGFGAALGILLSSNVFVIQIMALAFGIGAVMITYLISQRKKASTLFMLVLSGVITGAFFTALISLIKYAADPDDKLPEIVYWLMGSLTGTSINDVIISSPFIIGGMIILVLLRWKINILSLSEEEARSLGIDITKYRLIIIGASTIITAVSVALCGIVGWIGLVIPHVGRMIVGNDHKVLIPASIFLGGFYLLLIDNMSRILTSAEIPLSILTAVIGAPFFAYLLRKTGGRWA